MKGQKVKPKMNEQNNLKGNENFLPDEKTQGVQTRNREKLRGIQLMELSGELRRIKERAN